MATKTLTITEDAYNLLQQYKSTEESFSEEITRLFTRRRKRSLHDFFGVLSHQEGKAMQHDLAKIREENIRILKERLRHESSR